MIDINELRRLAQAVSGWSNCNQAWLDQWEDPPAAVVGHINEDGETYPVATIDCDQYYAAHESLQLAQFYAAANPATIIELLDSLEAAEKERDALRNEIACVKEVEFPRKAQAVADAWKGKCKRLEAERDELRAEIEAMEKQEPVAWISSGGDVARSKAFMDEMGFACAPLYLATGAQGEEK